MIKIYNTLTKEKQEFKPLSDEVGIYVCGMTVYDRCHIGHARVMVAFDVIVRHLRYRYPKVKYVRNITDIDDKIIKRAAENNEDIFSLTRRYIDLMHQDEKALNVLPVDAEPKATEYISQMQQLVQSLVDKGLAYVGENNDVYYAVDKFKDYGKLSGKSLDDLIAGTRVEVADAKHNPLDFVLWKSSKENEPSWQSPWGGGRPGWHLECSAMSNHHLGKTFDIHGGGADLSFPHHENEIAQSEGANNCTLANYWMHIGFVNIAGEKMSKSLNNFFTISDVLKEYDGEVIRYFILSSHYRSPLNYSQENLEIAKNALTRLYTAVRDIQIQTIEVVETNYQRDFDKAMDDDFNTPQALAVLFSLAKDINNAATNEKIHLVSVLKNLSSRLGILQNDEFFTQTSVDKEFIEDQIAKRSEAKINKNYALADSIRDELQAQGITLEDSPSGTTWRI
jgi:cysteinyl-tRNA synthetase